MSKVKIDRIVATTPNFSLSQLENCTWNVDSEIFSQFLAGHTVPQFTAIRSQKPAILIQTTDLENYLGNVPINGANAATVDTYQKVMGTVDSTARATLAHEKLTVTEGLFYWDNISLPHNGEASVDGRLLCRYDGSNDPIARTASQALPGNLTHTATFGLGKTSLNGTELAPVQSVEIASNFEAFQIGGKSDQWDTFVAHKSNQPVATIKLLDAQNFTTIGLDGLALNGSTGLTCFARKYSADGDRVANGTAEHIKFVIADGIAVPVDAQPDDGNGIVTDTIEVYGRAPDDSTQALVITTSSAIS